MPTTIKKYELMYTMRDGRITGWSVSWDYNMMFDSYNNRKVFRTEKRARQWIDAN